MTAAAEKPPADPMNPRVLGIRNCWFRMCVNVLSLDNVGQRKNIIGIGVITKEMNFRSGSAAKKRCHWERGLGRYLHLPDLNKFSGGS